MRVVVVHPNPDTARELLDVLSAELPEADMAIWSPDYPHQADYAAGWLPSAEFFAQQHQLRAFFSAWAGVERILASSTLPVTLPVIRLEDAGMGAHMSDYCVTAVMQWVRRRDEYEQQQRSRIWRQLPPHDVAEWPVGLFGFGVLGRRVAGAFDVLGFPVHGYARTAPEDAPFPCYAETGGAGDLAAFLRATRVLILLAPLTPQTRDRFDRNTLAQLPRGAYVVNVARGGLLVDEALLELLDAGHLAGAALDVFRQEPLPPDHPFWGHPKIQMTPHVAAVTLIVPTARQIAGKIRRFHAGEPVSGLVDRTRGY